MKTVTYNTTSEYKLAELNVLKLQMLDGVPIGDSFEFRVSQIEIQEDLTVSLEAMVQAEARRAYELLHIPVIVEHAGLVFRNFLSASYPGGLTKPMWNTLGTSFLEETGSAGREVVARACVGYCDGSTIRVFTGETPGRLATEARGGRHFYWDTIFIPEDNNPNGLTYAEIVEAFGLEAKVDISQSAKALRAFLTYRASAEPQLWTGH